MAKVIHKKGSEELAKLFLETYDPQSSDDVQNSFKDMIGTVFEALLQGELTDHLGFENNDHSAKDTTNRRNGSSKKTLKSSMGKIPINTPRDRDGSFNPLIVQKRKTDITGIEKKVLYFYVYRLSVCKYKTRNRNC